METKGVFGRYVLKLAHDPAAAEIHRTDPQRAKAAMTEAGLTPDQQQTLLSGKPDQIGAEMAKEFSGAQGAGILVICQIPIDTAGLR